MKKLLSVLLAVVMLASVSMSAFALGYGEEWEDYYHSAPTTFSDVPSSHWAYNAIMRVYEKNWFNGYPNGTFRPDGSITRAEALKVFVVFLGLDYLSVDTSKMTYSDVSADDWYAAYVEAGKDLFPVHTTIQGKTPFNPNMPVTREDTIYALVKALGCDVGSKYVDQSVLNMFTDASSISGSIKDEFAVALGHSLVSGFPDGTIRAQAALTRAEFATLLLRGTEHGFHDKYTAKIQNVNVTPANALSMTIGESVSLSARATYTDGTNQAYTSLQPYVESGSDVISLSGTTITALKAGKAVVKYNDSYLQGTTLNITVSAPTDAPTLKITGYDEETEEATMTVTGMATDKNGTVELTYNGRDAIVNADGSFSVKVSLKVGTNEITFVATNAYGVEATKTIVIERTESATAPVEPTTPTTPNSGNNTGNTSNTGSTSNDGTPYFTFDKSTGTITACGSSADDIVIPTQIDGVNVYHIGEGAFKNCKYLETVQFPSTLKTIGAEAFYGCIRLLDADIPEGVTKIEDSAFENCKSLAYVTIPEGVKVISSGTFYGCERLTDVSLPYGITKIEETAFAQCKSLAEITLPETVTTVEDGAFMNCGALKVAILPDSVSSIAEDAFSGCNALVINASVNSYALEYAKTNGIAWAIYEG